MHQLVNTILITWDRRAVVNLSHHFTEAYLEPSRTPTMDLFHRDI